MKKTIVLVKKLKEAVVLIRISLSEGKSLVKVHSKDITNKGITMPVYCQRSLNPCPCIRVSPSLVTMGTLPLVASKTAPVCSVGNYKHSSCRDAGRGTIYLCPGSDHISCSQSQRVSGLLSYNISISCVVYLSFAGG